MSFARIAASKVFRKSRGSVVATSGRERVCRGASVGRRGELDLEECRPGSAGLHRDFGHLPRQRAAERVCPEDLRGGNDAGDGGLRMRSRFVGEGWVGRCVCVGGRIVGRGGGRRGCDLRRKATEKLLGYFAKHTKRLNYRERLASGRAIGSGVVEGQAKTLGLRLKARAARWLKKKCSAPGQSGLRPELRPVGRLLELGGLTPREFGCTRVTVL